MNEKEIHENYENVINKFAVGYNKSIILNSVTLHSLDILDQAMSQVESGLNTIVSAFEEMRATSASTSDNSSRIDLMMSEILSKNTSMNSGIDERMKEIEEAVTNARSISALFEELKGKTENVAGITGSIQDVSDRTGILAINASIEAARAGTVGRGFRIIANEVRTLANQTGDFAKQIEVSIGEFQETVESINSKMASFTELFSRFKESFGDVLSNFSENAHTIDSAGQSLSQITGAIKEEALALNDGLTSLEKVNDSMRDTHAILGVIQRSHKYLDTLLEKSDESMGM
ncbi:MAG TPA: methyl-accepting chemotaxis protein [Treponemataceae bacterium]|nr:methyl-accepting chemotaxis protein [Treponemataceae bacterium]